LKERNKIGKRYKKKGSFHCFFKIGFIIDFLKIIVIDFLFKISN